MFDRFINFFILSWPLIWYLRYFFSRLYPTRFLIQWNFLSWCIPYPRRLWFRTHSLTPFTSPLWDFLLRVPSRFLTTILVLSIPLVLILEAFVLLRIFHFLLAWYAFFLGDLAHLPVSLFISDKLSLFIPSSKERSSFFSFLCDLLTWFHRFSLKKRFLGRLCHGSEWHGSKSTPEFI